MTVNLRLFVTYTKAVKKEIIIVFLRKLLEESCIFPFSESTRSKNSDTNK